MVTFDKLPLGAYSMNKVLVGPQCSLYPNNGNRASKLSFIKSRTNIVNAVTCCWNLKKGEISCAGEVGRIS